MDTETRQAIESLIAIIENSAPLAMGYRERALERAKALLRTQISPTTDKPRDEALRSSQSMSRNFLDAETGDARDTGVVR